MLYSRRVCIYVAGGWRAEREREREAYTISHGTLKSFATLVFSVSLQAPAFYFILFSFVFFVSEFA